MVPTPEDEILVACSRLHFDQVHRDRVTSACARALVNWELVYTAAVAHKIAPLVYKNLKCCGSIDDLLPRKVLDDFHTVSRWYALRNAIATKGIADLAAFFESRAHDVLLLKHAALSTRWPILYELTMSDDVDVVVRPRGEWVDPIGKRHLFKLRPWMFSDKLQRLLRRFTDEDTDHTSAVIREFAILDQPWRSICGLELENRIHHDVVWSGVVAIDFQTVWQDAHEDQIEARSVCVPSLCDLVIMSAVSIHRKPYLRLRNLIEIQELAPTLDDSEWDRLTTKARTYRCRQLVYSALHATKAMLESDIPQSALLALRPSALRGRAVALVNRRTSPTALCRSRDPGGPAGTPRRDFWHLARRFVAFDTGQLMRFVWFRIVLYRALRVIKW